MLPVRSSELLKRLGLSTAWWLAHDEADLSGMVSLLSPGDDDDSWSVQTLTLETTLEQRELTDAEALAYAEGSVFVFGSGFIGRNERLDDRRSFVVRFPEAAIEVDPGGLPHTSDTQVLDVGSIFVESVNRAIRDQGIELLPAAKRLTKKMKRSGFDELEQPINIEGVSFSGDNLVLGLRWPVTAKGEPIVAILWGARAVLTDESWSAAALGSCPVSVQVITGVGSTKRPAGIRGMAEDATESNSNLHVLVGPTERDLVAKSVRSAAPLHLEIDLANKAVVQRQSFEGFRKVEALAPARSGGWMYALDDEDAIVLLVESRT